MADWIDSNHIEDEFELVLFGLREHRLREVRRAASELLGKRVDVTSTVNLAASLANADLIIMQIRVGGLEARRFDESFPHAAQIPGEETLGPGGFANALRTAPVVAKYFADIAEMAPNALVVNLTNPAGIVRRIGASYGIRIVEVCEAPLVLLGEVAHVLDCATSDLVDRYVGLNHVGFYVPRDDQELHKLRGLVARGDNVLERFGALPLQYLRFYLDPLTILRAQVGNGTRADQLITLERSARVLLKSGDTVDPSARPSPWYSLAVMPLLTSLVRPSTDIRLIGTNNGTRLRTMSEDSTLEGPATINRYGEIVTRALVDVPTPVLDVLHRHAHYEDLALAACLSPTLETVRAALKANPMVSDDYQIATLINTLNSSEFGPTVMHPSESLPRS